MPKENPNKIDLSRNASRLTRWSIRWESACGCLFRKSSDRQSKKKSVGGSSIIFSMSQLSTMR